MKLNKLYDFFYPGENFSLLSSPPHYIYSNYYYYYFIPGRVEKEDNPLQQYYRYCRRRRITYLYAQKSVGGDNKSIPDKTANWAKCHQLRWSISHLSLSL